MQVYRKPVEKGFIFPCTKKIITSCFGQDSIEWVSFGAFGKHFSFDSQSRHRPQISGDVVAALTFCPDGHSYLCLYQVSEASYTNAGRTAFLEKVLPKFNAWLETKKQKFVTANSSHKQLIVSWNNNHHTVQEFEFLLATR